MIAWLAACGWVLPTRVEPGTPVSGCAALAAGVDPARPIADVRVLAAAPRRSEERRGEVRAWLKERLESQGFAVRLEPFALAGVSGVNVVAGSGRVLVGAHYDSVASTPGADDNASGVAAALEVARVLGPSAPVTFAFFDAEEPFDAAIPSDGRNFAFGSQALVDATPGAWDLAIVLESVGFSCDGCQQVPRGVPASFPRDGRALYQAVNRSDRDWSALVATWGAATPGRAVHAIAIPGEGRGLRQSRFSDHAPFWDAGVDAMLVTDTALLRNPHYHRGGDRPETLDPVLLADASRGTVALVGAAAGRCGAVGP